MKYQIIRLRDNDVFLLIDGKAVARFNSFHLALNDAIKRLKVDLTIEEYPSDALYALLGGK